MCQYIKWDSLRKFKQAWSHKVQSCKLVWGCFVGRWARRHLILLTLGLWVTPEPHVQPVSHLDFHSHFIPSLTKKEHEIELSLSFEHTGIQVQLQPDFCSPYTQIKVTKIRCVTWGKIYSFPGYLMAFLWVMFDHSLKTPNSCCKLNIPNEVLDNV